MSRVKERAKQRQYIKSRKKALKKLVDKFVDENYVDPNTAELISLGLEELVALQRQLNAMSADMDEEKLLKRAAKRVDGK